MGQQQILLLVLSIVIVSIAIYIGIDFFDSMMQQRHVDLLVNHGVHVASEAITWRTKGSPFLGGGGDYSSLGTNGMDQLLMSRKRIPGTFRITLANGDNLEVTGVSNDYPDIGVLITVVGEEITDTNIAYDGSITLP